MYTSLMVLVAILGTLFSVTISILSTLTLVMASLTRKRYVLKSAVVMA